MKVDEVGQLVEKKQGLRKSSFFSEKRQKRNVLPEFAGGRGRSAKTKKTKP